MLLSLLSTTALPVVTTAVNHTVRHHRVQANVTPSLDQLVPGVCVAYPLQVFLVAVAVSCFDYSKYRTTGWKIPPAINIRHPAPDITDKHRPIVRPSNT